MHMFKRYYYDIYKTNNEIKKEIVETSYKEEWMIRQELEILYPNSIVVLTRVEFVDKQGKRIIQEV